MSNSADWITPRPATDAAAAAARAATLRRRLTAAGYDALLLAAICFVVTALVVAVHRSGVPEGSGWFRLLLAATAWLYFAWCWVHGGQTVGMRAWKIRVIRAHGPIRQVSWLQATLRFAAALVPALPLALTAANVGLPTAAALAAVAFGAGFGLSLLRADRACWHDLVSGTRLLRAD